MSALRSLTVVVVTLAACSRPASTGSSRLTERLRHLRHSVAADAWPKPAVVEMRLAESRDRRPHDVVYAEHAALDSALWPTHVIPFTTTVAEPRTVWVGDRLTIEAPPVPEGTPPAIAADLRWTSDIPSIARVDRAGEVLAIAPGDAFVRAWRAVGETVVPVRVLPAVRGRVAAADGDAMRARIVVHSRDAVDSVVSDADGAFAVRVTHALRAPLAVSVTPLDDGYTNARLEGIPVERLGDLAVVLLPSRWTVRGGRYDGQSVDIAPAVAQAQAARGSRFWRVAGGPDRTVSGRPAVGWPVERLPVPVAFDPTLDVTAYDSLVFWRTVRQLERDWGARLFVPTTLAADDSVGAGTVVVTVEPRLRVDGLTTTSWNGSGDVSDGRLALRTRDYLRDPEIVTHELLHALGIGHAGSGWSSVMHPETNGMGDGRASREDIAYGQLLYAVRARTHAAPGRIAVGIAEAAAAAASGVP